MHFCVHSLASILSEHIDLGKLCSNVAELTKLEAVSPSPGFMKDFTVTNEAKYNLGKVKPSQCRRFVVGIWWRGVLQRGSQGHCLGCWLLLPPSALITQSKYTFRTLVFLSDVLPGAWHVDCGFVVMVISFLLRRVLPPLLLPLRHRPSN